MQAAADGAEGLIWVCRCHCELHDLVSLPENRSFKEVTAVYLFRQLARGVAALHAHGYSHGDIKTNNILLAFQEGGPSLKRTDYALKLTDWTTTSAVNEKSVRRPKSTYCVNCAPETTGDDYDTKAADVWQLGLVLLWMLANPVEASEEKKRYTRHKEKSTESTINSPTRQVHWKRYVWMERIRN